MERTKRALIVDDMKSSRMFVRMLLEKEGFEVIEETDGSNIMAKVRAAQPDVVVMDINMPGVDGLDCCRQIKANEQTRNLPVLIMTAQNNEEHQRAARAAGCDAFCPKPVDRNKLRGKLWVLMRLADKSAS